MSYQHQRSGQTFERVLREVRNKPGFVVYENWRIISRVLDGNPKGVSSAQIGVQSQGRFVEVRLLLGEGSYQVTDGYVDPDEALTGLFDPRGEPLTRERCELGDIVTAVGWRKDQHASDNEFGLNLPVRCFGNYARQYFMCSSELLGHLGIVALPDGIDSHNIIVAGSPERSKLYLTGRGEGGKHPTQYVVCHDPRVNEGMREFLTGLFEGAQRR